MHYGDQDDINLKAETPERAKERTAVLPQLLKWVAIVLAALIFIITVV